MDIWADDDTLVSQVELAETIICDNYGLTFFHCPACEHHYTLWTRIIEECGSAEYGHRAYAAMDLELFIETFKPDMSEIDSIGWNDVRAVKAERNRLQAQAEFNRQQQQASQPKA